MDAGQLRDLIYIQTPLSISGDTGQPKKVFATSVSGLTPVWASIKQISSTETQNEKGSPTLNKYKLVLRYTALTPQDRIIWGDKILNLSSVIVDEKQTQIIAEATYGGLFGE